FRRLPGFAGKACGELILQLRFEQLKVAEDDRQQVVEVMRHAAGELSNSFHPLRLLEGHRLLALFRDVLNEREGANLVAIPVDDAAVYCAGRKRSAVAPPEFEDAR